MQDRKFAVKRMAPARYDISGIKKVGVLNFGTGIRHLRTGPWQLTSTIENKLIQNGFAQRWRPG